MLQLETTNCLRSHRLNNRSNKFKIIAGSYHFSRVVLCSVVYRRCVFDIILFCGSNTAGAVLIFRNLSLNYDSKREPFLFIFKPLGYHQMGARCLKSKQLICVG